MNNYFAVTPVFIRNKTKEERESTLHSKVKMFLKNICQDAVSYLAELQGFLS
jgi:hypothetical protein